MSSSVRQRTKLKKEAKNTTKMSETPRTLYYYHQLDEWQQDNHYIKSGYVKETNSYKKSLLSLLYLNNESVNIYTHLIPSTIVILSILYYCENYLPIYDTYLGWEKLNFLQFGLAATICLLSSSSFHCFKSHSFKVCKFGNQLDYFGIVILITCSLISVMMFSFYDDSFWKYTFIVLFLVLGSICAFLTLDPKFSSSVYRPLRSTMFILFGLSGTFPVMIAIWKYGVSEASNRSGLKWILLEAFFYIFGAVLYAVRFPERLTYVDEVYDLLNNPVSGKFDIFGNSHQIFHVMVVIAAYFHWLALVESYDFLHSNLGSAH